MRERDDGGGRQVAVPLTTRISDVEQPPSPSPVFEEPDAPSWLLNRTFSGAIILLGGLIALYLYTQTVVLIGTILTYPTWIMYPALVVLVALVAMVAWSVLELIVTYYRLMQNRQIQMDEIRLLMERKMVEQATSRKKEARVQLIEYLKRYDLESKEFESALAVAGVSEDQELSRIRQNRQRLMTAEFEDTQRWLEEFRDGFQSPLDLAAERVIGKYMKRIGIATAAVPKGLIDSLIVTWGSVNMLRELCVIYNLRLGRIGTFVLLGKVFRNVFIAGEMSDVTNAVVQDLSMRIHDGIGVTSDALTSVAATAGGKILGRVSEGLINALLIRRLGYGAQKILRPCSV